MDQLTQCTDGYKGYFVDAYSTGSGQPYGHAETRPANAMPIGLLPPLAPSEPRISLSSRYFLSSGLSLNATSQLQSEYAYRDLYNRYYNSDTLGRMGLSNLPALDQPRADFVHIPPVTLGSSLVHNSGHFLGSRSHNSFPGNDISSLSGGSLDIKMETVAHNSRALNSFDSLFRVPQLPAHSVLPSVTVKTEADSLKSNNVQSESDSSYLDVPPASVQIDVVGIGNDIEHTKQEYNGFTNDAQSRERVNNGHEIRNILSNTDSGIASDLSSNASDANQGGLSRSNVITPPAGSDGENEKFQTPEGSTSDSASFITPIQHPHGKQLFPDPVGASTPMEDDSLWRPWNKSAKNLKRPRYSDQPSTSSNLDISQADFAKHSDSSGESCDNSKRKYIKSTPTDTNALSQDMEPTRFISPVPPTTSSNYVKHRARLNRKSRSPKNQTQTFSHSFSIAAMLNEDNSARPCETNQPQESQQGSQSVQMSYSSNYPGHTVFQANAQQYSSLQSYIRPATINSASVTDGPINLSYNSSHPATIQPLTSSLQERLAYTAARNEQFYQNAQLMLHAHAHLRPEHTVAPFLPPHPILSPTAAIAATFGSEPVSNSTQLHHLPGYPHNPPTFLGPITTTYPSIPEASSTTENEVLDLSDSSRSASRHQPEPSISPAQDPSSSSEDDLSAAHSSDAHTSQSPPSPGPSFLNRPVVQPASSQPIPGVVLSSPPAGARPASAFVHTKRLIPKSVLLAAKRRQAKADAGQAKKRDRPPQFGEDEIKVLEVRFFDSPERSRFCNENNEFVVPKVPDSREAQDELRDALSRLYERSNLPKVPSAFMYNVHALAYYPFMQHLFHLYLVKGINIYEFKFGAYGQAFENPRLRELGEMEFNNRLDSMCYVGEDNLLHCLVMRHIDNGARCDHVASELGKMRRHAKNHYPEKKWVCCFCRAQMPDLTDMERHTSTHTSLKPFRCVDCNKFFSQKVTLANHMNQHHQKKLQKMDPRKSFTCRQDGCLFQDHQREACIEHLINHHRDDEYIRRSKRGMWPFPPKPRPASRASGSAKSAGPSSAHSRSDRPNSFSAADDGGRVSLTGNNARD